MFKPVKATTVTSYIASIPSERKSLIKALHQLIRETVPGLRPYFANNMIGYGKFAYINYKKETIDWPIIALANQKQYISLYVCALKDGEYIAEIYKDKLGKVSVGKSCIRFKMLDDLHIPTLKKVLIYGAKHPGLR